MEFKSDTGGYRSTHVPVLAETAVELLACSPGKVIVDATVGGGGHAEVILERISATGTFVGIDCDSEAIEFAKKRLGKRPNVVLIRENFRNLGEVLERLNVREIDGLLFDLGLSSFQVDKPERGFSFQQDGPLDMRMDNRLATTADDIVNKSAEKELARILKDFGEERHARRIAKAIVKHRGERPIRTTKELAGIVRSAAPRTPRHKIDAATRTFQALRIAVNRELDNLAEALNAGVSALRARGRICVISFHSLEDRIVKQTFVRAARGCVCPPHFPQCVCGRSPRLKVITPKPIRPSSDEVKANPRSRSARLRAAEKLAGQRSA